MPKKTAAKKAKPTKKPWEKSMPKAQFELMRDILAAPSPIGLESAMSYGVIKPEFEKWMPKSWAIHQFKGNAGLVIDTHPGEDDRTSVMIIGHADKIRMQVRNIDNDGKIWINTDSFLPCTLVGHEVKLFSQDPKDPSKYNIIEGGTIEALGAIHFSEPAQRTGDKGLKPEMMYLELQMHGEKRKERIEELGIRAGDPIILDRPIKHGFSEDSFYGAYLDNGLGCFVVTEIAKILAKSKLKNLRVLYTIATHEEIGRFGSAAIAGEFKPDILIGSDVNHDYDAAPGIAAKRMNKMTMGEGFTITKGSVTSDYVNSLIEKVCKKEGIPYQMDFAGRDTGTDAMAAALAGFDSASTSIGFPIRNMHTISETGHTSDVIGAVHAMVALFREMDKMNRGKGITRDDLKNTHPRLDQAKSL
ncbi:endoglucanase [Rubritalea squalenifaciens DSM 18772]|uniref:Endoglucanase n=1 Tax=Rubritalea squalenifaciens DSM 18772 TaxID=1123071 RepID=A0A1M6IRA1_9BACT|nr:M28 family peptidase [Rubritalea squalenifaciens]SHJ37001.1 endoglucanase [Rubritalea squalenifaciens DSM 18772]